MEVKIEDFKEEIELSAQQRKKTVNTCGACGKNFVIKSNLKRHMKNVHPTKDEPVKHQQFICYHCSNSFCNKYNLIRHLPKCTALYDNAKKEKIKCILCNNYIGTKINLLQHYNQNHEIDVTIHKLNFESHSEFEKWKDQFEKDTVSRFIKFDSKKGSGKTTYYYKCHRDGFYKSGGKNIRRLKLLGSNKINGYCPAKINTTITKATGQVSIEFLASHVGHSMDLERIPLKKSDRNFLASKLSQKIPFDEVINEVRNNISENNLDRIHLLTRKDLFNIGRLYKLDKDSVRHQSDTVNIETWIAQAQLNNTYSVVRYYKKRGEINYEDKYNELQLNDFLLIIMNDAQLEILKKFGNDFLCVDSIYGVNAFDFELTTLMVLDDLRQGFPCMFTFSNRSDIYVFKIMFDVLKTILAGDMIQPKVFMSDMADKYYNSWWEIMGPVDIRLISSWHVNKTWQKHVSVKVKGIQKQANVHKNLRMLLEEPDTKEFQKMLQNCMMEFNGDPSLQSFGVYFNNNFVINQSLWAYCYRQHSGLNATMYLERMHKALEYIYLKGKTLQQLDKTISSIMQMVRDKLFERLVVLNKGKMSIKLNDLGVRHKSVKSLEDSTILANEDGTWTVMSSKGSEMYQIERSNSACLCELICNECNACMHAYICSCPDSSIKWNMCKHIHLLCTHLKKTVTTLPLPEAEDQVDETMLLVDENSANSNEHDIMRLLTTNATEAIMDLEQYKSSILENVHIILNSMNTLEQCKEIEKALLPFLPTLTTLEAAPLPTEYATEEEKLKGGVQTEYYTIQTQ